MMLKQLLHLLLLTSFIPLFAEEEKSENLEILFNAKADKKSIYIADRITLTLSLEIPLDLKEKINLPLFEKAINEFKIIDFKIKETKVEPNKIKIETIYFLTLYQTGQFNIPALHLSIPEEIVAFPKRLTTKPIPIKVRSLISNTNELNENNFLYTIDGKINENIYFLIGLLFLITLSILLFYYWRSKKDTPFYLIIEKEYKKLLSHYSFPLTAEKTKKFYFEKYKLVKQFLAKKYNNKKIWGFTSGQTLTFLSQKIDKHMEFYRFFFNYSDQIKFSEKKNQKEKDDYLIKYFENIIEQEKNKARKKKSIEK